MGDITTLLLAFLLVCFGFVAVFLFRAVGTLGKLLELMQSWDHPPVAEVELRRGNLDEVIRRCLADIAETPRHVKAHWYLGRAYYAKQMWHEARRALETVGELDPSWRREHTQPYLDEIDKRLSAGKA